MSRPFDRMSILDQVKALGGVGRGGGTRRLAEARATKSGKSVDTEMRAIQRAVKAGKPPAKQAPEVARAGANSAAANALRSARVIDVGDVSVEYPTARGGRSEGSRSLGSFTIGGELAGVLAEAADLLDAGDEQGAMDLIGEGLLDEYGDLGGTLKISDFKNGIRFR